MKINKIKVLNFRSIKSIEITTNDFNLFVGQNNCGKTNLFEAIEYFYNGIPRGLDLNELTFKRNRENEVLVELEFSGAQEGMAKMVNEANRTKIEKVLNGSDLVTIQRIGTQARKVFVSGNEVNPGTGFDKALNDFLPKFEYISTKQYFDSVAKYARTTPIGIMLSGVLSTILTKNKQYQDFQQTFKDLFEDEKSEIKAEFEVIGGKVQAHLEKQFPDATKVKFEVTAPAFDDLLKNFSTSIDDGVETSAEEKGDGMQRALMLAIIQAYADFRKQNEDTGKSFLFFIDEAELHLHPTAQRKLKDVLYKLSQEGDQVFISTHSSVFVADNYERQTIFKVEKHDGETDIDAVSDAQKPYVVYELLGGSPTDLLLPGNFLIVEGLSEFELITRVISRFYSDRRPIQILIANGDIDQAERSINSIDKIFNPVSTTIYRDRVVLLCDHPSEERAAGVREFIGKYPYLQENSQYFQLPHRDIEQCYPDKPCEIYGNWRKTQDDIDATNEAGKKLFTGKKKRQLAKHIGNRISQEEFEADLSTCFNALQRCWELAYN